MTKGDVKEIIQREGNSKIWKHSGLLCVAYRFRQFGHWCGYVGIDKNNMLYKKDYDKNLKCLNKTLKEKMKKPYKKEHLSMSVMISCLRGSIEPNISNVLSVHGGVTFAGKLNSWNYDNKWFIGFDTAHCDDYSVWLDTRNNDDYVLINNGEYRDLQYVIKETNSLAKQISYFEK